jgi:hypothetical protein
VIEATLACGRLTNPDIRCVGLAVNTAALGEEEARRYLDELGTAEGLPASDPVRFGVEAIVRNLRDAFSGAGAVARAGLAPEPRVAPVTPAVSEVPGSDGEAQNGSDGLVASPDPPMAEARPTAEAAPALELAVREPISQEPLPQDPSQQPPLPQDPSSQASAPEAGAVRA